MTSIKFIDKEIKKTERSFHSFELDYRLFGRESDRKDADKLRKKLIYLQQIKEELISYNGLKINYDVAYECLKKSHDEIQNLRKELDIEKCKGIAYWEDFKKLKKFTLHFKSDIQEGLNANYRRGENVVYDTLLDEFGKVFLNDLLKVILKDEYVLLEKVLSND